MFDYIVAAIRLEPGAGQQLEYAFPSRADYNQAVQNDSPGNLFDDLFDSIADWFEGLFGG